MGFKEITVKDLELDPFESIGKYWFLITAGAENNFNTMTASWGSLGFLWNKNVATIYVRPQRYTHEFLENNDSFSLCFFEKEHKKTLSFCGTHSGKECDKIKETGLVPVFGESAPYFEQARLALVCKKLYSQEMNLSCFCGKSVIDDWYKEEGLKKSFSSGDLAKCFGNDKKPHDMAKMNGIHKMYIGEITKCLAQI